MMQTRWQFWPLTMLLTLALVVAACGPAPVGDGTGVASLDEPAATTAPGGSDTTTPQDREEAIAAYEDCMTEEGVELAIEHSGDDAVRVNEDDEHSDPQTGAGPDGVDSEALHAAEEKCGPLLGDAFGVIELDPEEQARYEDAQMKWQDCMEEQGVDITDDAMGLGGGEIAIDVPDAGSDPQNDGSFPPMDPKFEAAGKECDHIWEDIADIIGEGEVEE